MTNLGYVTAATKQNLGYDIAATSENLGYGNLVDEDIILIEGFETGSLSNYSGVNQNTGNAFATQNAIGSGLEANSENDYALQMAGVKNLYRMKNNSPTIEPGGIYQFAWMPLKIPNDFQCKFKFFTGSDNQKNEYEIQFFGDGTFRLERDTNGTLSTIAEDPSGYGISWTDNQYYVVTLKIDTPDITTHFDITLHFGNPDDDPNNQVAHLAGDDPNGIRTPGLIYGWRTNDPAKCRWDSLIKRPDDYVIG